MEVDVDKYLVRFHHLSSYLHYLLFDGLQLDYCQKSSHFIQAFLVDFE